MPPPPLPPFNEFNCFTFGAEGLSQQHFLLETRILRYQHHLFLREINVSPKLVKCLTYEYVPSRCV